MLNTIPIPGQLWEPSNEHQQWLKKISLHFDTKPVMVIELENTSRPNRLVWFLTAEGEKLSMTLHFFCIDYIPCKV